MKQVLIGLGVFLALTGTSAAKGNHAMTQSEFRQVLHERDVAIARAWQQAEAEQQRESLAESAAIIRDCERCQKIRRAYREAQSVLTEKEKTPGFAAKQANLRRESEAIVDDAASLRAQAFIRRAWAAHRFNQGN